MCRASTGGGGSGRNRSQPSGGGAKRPKNSKKIFLMAPLVNRNCGIASLGPIIVQSNIVREKDGGGPERGRYVSELAAAFYVGLWAGGGGNVDRSRPV